MRGTLLDADDVYWGDGDSSKVTEPTHSEPDPRSYLSFWHVDGTQNGEDVKRDVKARLIEAPTLLTHDKCLDVVNEASRYVRGTRSEIRLGRLDSASSPPTPTSPGSPIAPVPRLKQMELYLESPMDHACVPGWQV